MYCFSVVLALDKDLNSLAPEADNRLSDDKENAIKQILSAKVMSTELVMFLISKKSLTFNC